MSLTVCPKCSYQRLPTDAHIHAGVCPSCGIAYQKFLDRQQQPAPAFTLAPVPQRAQLLKQRLLELPPEVDGMAFGARAGAWCAFALWAVWFTVHGIDWEIIGSSFLHNIILPFHEFGHVLFMPFGRFMTVLGGSLTQVLVPLVCAGAFLWQARDPFGAAVASWWAGENLIDVAPYINDARELRLVLLGGRTGAEVEGHDWEYLLNAMGMAHKDHTIAAAVHTIGILIMIAGLAWGAIVVLNQLGMLRRNRPT